jgi:UDP-N-acetylglucosamine--N-acetylmuramyl-(pentapeptide) pyrophosphoryl-undecaprenol N-acetylglucosamine transferase
MYNKSNDELRVLFTGGGTGGNIFPIVAVARALKELAQVQGVKNLKLYFVGPNHFTQSSLAPEGIEVYSTLAGKIHRFWTWKLLLEIPKALTGFIQAQWRVWQIMPDVIWAKGGFGSFFPALIGWLFHIPVILHESDSVPGLSNRLLKIFAARIGLSFASALSYFPAQKTALVGNPIRETFLKREPAPVIKLQNEKPIILVLGGSLGAGSINELVAQVLRELLAKYQVIHQVGNRNLQEYKEMLEKIYGIAPDTPDYYLYGFLTEMQMAHALSSADLVVSRAGAGSIYEIAASGKPSILIPLPDSAGDHQLQNAFEYARAGAARVLESANLKPHLLFNEIHRILRDPETKEKMSQAAKNFAKTDAAQNIAQEILEVALS